MKKPLENLIAEFFVEHPDATLYVRKDLLNSYEVGVAGENHTHAPTVAEGIRKYWGGEFLSQPPCSMEIESHD